MSGSVRGAGSAGKLGAPLQGVAGVGDWQTSLRLRPA